MRGRSCEQRCSTAVADSAFENIALHVLFLDAIRQPVKIVYAFHSYKSIGQYLPRDAKPLEPILKCLKNCHVKGPEESEKRSYAHSFPLNAVGNGALHPLKENQSSEQNHEHGPAGNGKTNRRRLAMSCQRPSKTVDHACHRIQTVEP